MNGKDFERWLAENTGLLAADIDQATRYLRAAGLLPKSGHGPHAAQIGVNEVATILIAASAPKAARCADWVGVVGEMVVSDGRRDRTFRDALRRMLGDAENTDGVSQLIISGTVPQAIVTADDGSVTVFLPPEIDAVRHNLFKGLCISGGALSHIAMEISEEAKSESDGFTRPAGMAAALAKTKETMDA
jgi:hypothetical protein